jgi:bacillithiol biosynthesis cysteine-adding enzyme BshC
MTGALPRIEITTGTSRFIRDYLGGDPKLAPFYTGHPYDPAAYVRKAAEVRQRMDAAKRQRVADAYRPLNDAARARLAAVLSGDGFVVTTGQQAGVFGGPLYTIYKALSAVRLAAALEEQLRCPVLAVFWIAADDHDWAEVDHVRVLDQYAYLRDIRVRTAGNDPPWPMSRKVLGNGVTAAIDELAQLLPADGFGADARALLRRTYKPDTTVAAAFEELLAEILEPYPVAIVSSAHPLIKSASAELFEHELKHTVEHGALIQRQTERLERLGYRAQVQVTPNASNVFLLRETGRDRLVRDRDAWALRRTGERLDDASLSRLIHDDPSVLSANVFFRPVVESAVFPTLSYVGGPAETAYFAQIGCLFEAHGVMPPIVFPRHGATIIEEKALRTLNKFGYAADVVRAPFSDVVKRLVREEMPDVVRGALDGIERAMADGFQSLENAVPAVDPTLAGPVRRSRYRASLEVRRIEKQIENQYRTRNSDRIEQLRRAASAIHPDGQPQERVLNVVPLLAKYGPGVLSAVHDAMSVALDRTMPEWSGVDCGDHISGGQD